MINKKPALDGIVDTIRDELQGLSMEQQLEFLGEIKYTLEDLQQDILDTPEDKNYD